MAGGVDGMGTDSRRAERARGRGFLVRHVAVPSERDWKAIIRRRDAPSVGS